ncbi:MAG: sodium-dependent transporter [Gammaproteobacteria bacterium]|nr:sodium-dependent transporter [Gammaproteobacteria bacterium]
MSVATPQWASRYAFLMAAIGSAVGLGNLWRFPFQAGQNGGSAFVIIYLVCVIIVAYPILIAELAIGRHKGLSAVGSTRQLALDIGRSRNWAVVGWIGVIASFIILSTYSIIAGQVLAYSVMSVSGEFAQYASNDAAQTLSLYAGPTHALMWHTLFMVVTILIVSAGLHGGIERVVTVLMPIFFVMLAGLCVYALTTGAAKDAIKYLFAPDFSALTPTIVLAALGQAFFSIGIGAAIMITYGSFLPKEEHIGGSAAIIAGSDTMVAIVAGLMIFPIVFAHGLDPAAGSGLIFGAMPAVFAGMPAGSIIGGLFFFLAFIAALTTSISILITVSAVVVEELGLNRIKSAFAVGVLVWAVGAATVMISGLSGWLEFLSGSVLLPFCGLLVAALAGWVVPRNIMRNELTATSDGLFKFWRVLIRYVATIAIALILLLGIDEKVNFGLNQLITRLTGG